MIAEQTEKDIDETRSQYIPVAVRTRILFFCTYDLVRSSPVAVIVTTVVNKICCQQRFVHNTLVAWAAERGRQGDHNSKNSLKSGATKIDNWGRGAHINIFMFCTINLFFLLCGSNNVIGENSSGGPACSKLINKLLQIQHKICAIPTSMQDFKNLLRLNIFDYHFNLTGEHRSYVPVLTGMVYQYFLKQHRKCRTSR